MSGANFLLFARDANFLQNLEANRDDGGFVAPTCTPLDVRKAFAASRNDGGVNVTFGEFIEAFARLGIIAFYNQSSKNPGRDEDRLIDCIRRALVCCNVMYK